MKDAQEAHRLRALAAYLREIAPLMATTATASALRSKADRYIVQALKLAEQ